MALGGLWSAGAATRSQLPEGLLAHCHNWCWPMQPLPLFFSCVHPDPQGLPPPPASASVYSPTAVTLAIHPLESPRNTGPPPAPIHPLSRRYQPPTQNSPSVMPPLRIEDYMATVDEPQPEELERTPQGNANEVRRASERERTSKVLANQTKENPHQAQHQAQSRPRDSNMSMAKAATEKLKWKFLGW